MAKKSQLKLSLLKCERCGYIWPLSTPRLPKKCSRCGSPAWRRKRYKGEKGPNPIRKWSELAPTQRTADSPIRKY